MADFREFAACRDVDPELFFPTGEGAAARADVARAVAVCRTCAVSVPCLEWALTTGQDEGVWGGLDPGERRRLRRALRRPA